MRLIRAEVLKLRRRNGMVAMSAVLTVVAVAVYYAIQAIRGDADGHFNDAIAVLAMAGSVAGAIVGATAGAADIEAGVFRDLVATGRSRLALFFARLPGRVGDRPAAAGAGRRAGRRASTPRRAATSSPAPRRCSPRAR